MSSNKLPRNHPPFREDIREIGQQEARSLNSGETHQKIRKKTLIYANDSFFNNKLLLMQYGQDEVYIDSTKTKAETTFSA